MEVTFMYFWVIKFTIIVAPLVVLYKAIKSYKKTGKHSKMWLSIFAVLALISIFTPIRIDGTNTHEAIAKQSRFIESSKELPEIVKDSSFKDTVKSVAGIEKSDLK